MISTNKTTSNLASVDPDSVQFLAFTDEDVKKLSVVKITEFSSFDILGNPNKGGLYDNAMGPVRDRVDMCSTCGNVLIHCPGHFGHIELPLVVVNPIFFKNIYTLFRISCLTCFRVQMNDKMKSFLTLQLQLIDAGHITAALDLQSYTPDVITNSESCPTILDNYKKLLNETDPIVETFHNKNVDKIRVKTIADYFKVVNIINKCIHCSNKLIKVTKSQGKIMMNTVTEGIKSTKILMPDEIRNYCNSIATNDEDFLKTIFPILQYVESKPSTSVFFMEVIPVVPPNVRPCNILRGQIVEHPQSSIYKHIISTANQIRSILNVMHFGDDADVATEKLGRTVRELYHSISGKSSAEKLHTCWMNLQKAVNDLLDCSGKSGMGLKQIVEKKEGLIRMHMMGKRVNFAARSVITPDPNVDIDEIGIPDVFAKKLTYPIPVTEWNVDELRRMIINGPNVHPGAEKLEIENGRIIRIPGDSIQKRKGIAKRLLTPDEYKTSGLKIVHRHLINGDILILNRQPTLHKPSMMAHKARILKGEKTLRLHYANCKSYNADFDGDEMNAHFPQNEIARSEAYNIMSVRKQFLVPKDGTPLSGLIQDHVISGVKMSLRGNFFTKSDYQQLVFQALAKHNGKIKLLPPTILKPVMLWSGKQILSTIIINTIPKGKPLLSLTSKAKIGAKAWQNATPRKWKAGGTSFANENTMSEAEVVIQKGELLSGVLDKTHYGATPFGLVHCMYELYGGDSSTALLSSFSKLFTFYLQWIGFTLGVKDILVVEEADEKRDDYIRLVRQAGKLAAVKATDTSADIDEATLKATIEEMHAKDPKFRAALDRQYKNLLDSHTNKINKACLIEGLLEKFPSNNLQLMVQSGAKGSTVNTMQISCLLGQIELEGKRPPLMISGRSLPSFEPYDITPRAGGFIDGRFLTGIQPQEFFFHCMAGREGLIDTAVKTSRSGYLQRCLIKHLESLSVAYDYTVRDSDGSVIQFTYGEDGLDVLKCQFLKEKQLTFLDTNSNALMTKEAMEKLKEANDDPKTLNKAKKSLKKWRKKNGSPFDKVRCSGFTKFSAIVKDEIEPENAKDSANRDPYYWAIERRWRELDEDERQQFIQKRCPDPIPNKLAPEMKLGVINEQLDDVIQNYLKKREISPYLVYTDKNQFTEIMNAKYLASMADPGEPVGLLAAQSIGEPSTQMTLNTFHFAGRGDMNVTLGIPRLREILMTASAKLKTPNMDIPFRADLEKLNKKAEKLRQKLNRVTVADVLEKIDVKCEVVVYPNRELKTTMRFSFLPYSQYKTQYAVKPERIIKHMQNKFFDQMFMVIRKHTRATTGVAFASDKKSSKKKINDDDDVDDEPAQIANNDLDSSDDEGPNPDDDETENKIRKKRTEEQEYEDGESEDEDKSEDENELEDPESNELEDPESNLQKDETADLEVDTSKIDTKVVQKISNATNYAYDSKNYQWCELTVLFPIYFLRINLAEALRETASKSIIHEVKHIKRAITDKVKDKLHIKTEGINILEMFKYDHLLDLNRLYSNDIHAIANTYGIEAANKVIIKEIQNVFQVYGIVVDPRHLSLIADYMTFNGIFEPMSRRGMEASASPLQQMSFESSLIFLKNAVVNARRDNLKSASSCLFVGQPCVTGTGIFALQHHNKLVS